MIDGSSLKNKGIPTPFQAEHFHNAKVESHGFHTIHLVSMETSWVAENDTCGDYAKQPPSPPNEPIYHNADMIL